jgi:hypothetical protein
MYYDESFHDVTFSGNKVIDKATILEETID